MKKDIKINGNIISNYEGVNGRPRKPENILKNLTAAISGEPITISDATIGPIINKLIETLRGNRVLEHSHLSFEDYLKAHYPVYLKAITTIPAIPNKLYYGKKNRNKKRAGIGKAERS